MPQVKQVKVRARNADNVMRKALLQAQAEGKPGDTVWQHAEIG